ncbi:nuclear transport factor 2 family protein [Aeromicrobium terrae]|uniref:Nuclear transport factor 2 family protein n=1 Tax=Aeromicrobium terrae TaxID=2498846 RepID=A0A5C8NME5_9ACTN|nr:nuclear transport factor 2 family protein [Aeromicrobium terrae]TXL62095.1 nuclear transport factor 2 family protein [Aeromicrobium terrae]
MSDEAANRRILEAMFGVDGTLLLSPEQEYEARSPDYVMEMPQSGERIVGRDAMRAMQEAFPNPPAATVRRIVGSGDVFVMEATSEYPGAGTFHVADIVEFADGKIVRETRYYAEPFDPPEWRAEWVE